MKTKLKKIINKYKLMPLTEANLNHWGFNWENASPSRIRMCAIDAFFHIMRFSSSTERRKYLKAEFNFIESLSLAIGITPNSLYKSRSQLRGGAVKYHEAK